MPTLTLRPRLPKRDPHRAAALAALESRGTALVPFASDDPDALAARVLALALRDAAEGGWGLVWQPASGTLLASPPGDAEAAPDVQKARVRAGLVRARDAQLAEPGLRRFVARMEGHRDRAGRPRSVRDLFLSPAALATDVARVRAAPPSHRDRLAAALVDPYVEVCTPDAVDAYTGLRLQDVWRYARYTWSLPYDTVPGRRMLVLVRDRSRPRHPVVALGALSSSAVQITVRDRAIGWHPLALDANDALADLVARGALDHVVALITEGHVARAAEWVQGDRWLPGHDLSRHDDAPTDDALLDARVRLLEAEFDTPAAEVVAHLEAVIDQRVTDLYVDDLLGEFSRQQFGKPSEATLLRLAEIRDGLTYASRILDDPDTDSLVDAAESPRYTRKRVVELHKLLRARRLFQEARRHRTPDAAARWLLAKSSRRLALKTALREIKKAHVGASVMDVTTCGAVAPYNQLLGGKLAALLMASPAVVDAYRERYDGADSVIASRMQGRPVQRPADLALLCTTSLYGVGSSQYNRLRLRLADGPRGARRELAYHLAGKTLGFGTVHVAADTYEAMKALLAVHARSESSQFGAGVNVKMRTVGAALALVGLHDLQQHQESRLVYLAPLAPNWRRALLGLDTAPTYALEGEEGTAEVVEAWKARYLVPRVLRTLDGHGAPFDLPEQIRAEQRVHVEALPPPLGPLFNEPELAADG